MGFVDKFLNTFNLNDDDGYDDDDFLDDEIDENYDEEERPSKRHIFRKSAAEEESFDDEDELLQRKTKSQPKTKPRQTRAQTSPSGSSKISPMRPKKTGNGMEVCVIQPKSFAETKEITDTLLANCTVVLNLEGMDVNLAQRIIDFASGSCYAIDGTLQKIGTNIFIATPANVDVSGDFPGKQQILNGGSIDTSSMR